MISQLISNIKVGIKHKKTHIVVSNNKFIYIVLEALWDEKIILGFYCEGNFIIVLLKYDVWNISLIKDLNCLWNPGNKQYLTITKILKSDYKLIFFLSTSKGVMSIKKAISLNVGGQLLLSVSLN